MASRIRDLTADQLDWCRKTMPSFAKANADVLRRDADIAENWRRFHPAPLPALDDRLIAEAFVPQGSDAGRHFRVVG